MATQGEAQAQVPQRLVEERGVERRELLVAPGSVRGRDLQPPWQVRRPAEQLLVPPVAQPPDGLGQGQGRRRAVGRREQRDALLRGAPQTDGHTERDAAPDAEAALPDVEDPDRVVPEQLPVGDDVVEPRPDHPGGNGPEGDRRRVVAGAERLLLQPATEQPHRGDHAERDHQPVHPQLEAADVDGAAAGTRDRGEQAGGQHGVTLTATAPGNGFTRPPSRPSRRPPPARRRAARRSRGWPRGSCSPG